MVETEAEGGLIDMGEADEAEGRVYELGYHILPSVATSDLEGEVETISKTLKKLKAEVVAERPPRLIDLAYTIEKKIDGVNRRFDTAYFGWVAFELPADTIAELKSAMDTNPVILRHLIIKTDRDAVAASLADSAADVAGVDEVATPEAAPEVEVKEKETA